MSEFSLELSTLVKPPKQLKVDGKAYNMLGVDHLSPTDEAEVLARFSRHAILVNELDAERNVTKGKILAERARAERMKVIGKLTTIPSDVAEKLPLTAQVKLLEAIRAEVEAEDDEEAAAIEPAGLEDSASVGGDDPDSA